MSVEPACSNPDQNMAEKKNKTAITPTLFLSPLLSPPKAITYPKYPVATIAITVPEDLAIASTSIGTTPANNKPITTIPTNPITEVKDFNLV